MAELSLTIRPNKYHEAAWHWRRHHAAADPAQRQAANRNALSESVDRENSGGNGSLVLPCLLVHPLSIRVCAHSEDYLTSGVRDLTKLVFIHSSQ
ncbi:MAG: hypothetical protein WA676_17620 [Candidatus Sulfotelmatobacter sp.]